MGLPFLLPLLLGAGGLLKKQASAAGQMSRQEKEQLALLLDNQKKLQPFGMRALDTGMQDTMSMRDRWRRLMRGDQDTINRLFGSRFADMGAQYGAVNRTMSELQPRGGMSSDMRARLPFDLIRDKRQMVSEAQSDAEGNLASQSTNLLGFGAGALGQSGSGAMSLLDYHRQRRSDEMAAGRGMASSLANLGMMFFGNRGA